MSKFSGVLNLDGSAMDPFAQARDKNPTRTELKSGPVLVRTSGFASSDTNRIGDLCSFAGRLDNAGEIATMLDQREHANDSVVLGHAFEKWREGCFARLVGEWVAAIWSPVRSSLFLARDHAGTICLYVRRISNQLRWSSEMEELLDCGPPSRLSEPYLARYLAGAPRGGCTPYADVESVLPGHYTTVASGMVKAHQYWYPSRIGLLTGAKDSECEARFRELFGQAVQRRLTAPETTVAQLSGGLDSSAIVCMADRLQTAQPALRTLSFYDDTEPDWNERPHFEFIEERRGKKGTHVELSFASFEAAPPDLAEGRWLVPGFDRGRAAAFRRIGNALASLGAEAILSGNGGDELLGGVPAPEIELADELASMHLRSFFAKTLRWSLHHRATVWQMAGRALRSLMGSIGQRISPDASSPPWLSQRTRMALEEPARLSSDHASFAFTRPSALSNGLSWWALVESLPHLEHNPHVRQQYRYPYLDKDLVEFLFSLPREQLLRPGQRRSLMRRALKGIVPGEVLGQTRKQVVSRGPLRLLERSRDPIVALINNSLLHRRGWIDANRFCQALARTTATRDPAWSLPLLRTVQAELWLASSLENGLLGL